MNSLPAFFPVYQLCLDCVQNTGAIAAVSSSPDSRCVVCGDKRQGCKPAGPTDVQKAFGVYFERLQMVLARAAAKPAAPPAARPVPQPQGRFNRTRLS